MVSCIHHCSKAWTWYWSSLRLNIPYAIEPLLSTWNFAPSIYRVIVNTTFAIYNWIVSWRNVPFMHMRTAKTKIRLRMRAVWSRPSLSAYRIIGTCRKYRCTAKALINFSGYVGWSGSLVYFCGTNVPFLMAWLDQTVQRTPVHQMRRLI